MITEETAVNVLQEFLSAKLGRTVSETEATAALMALDKAYARGQIEAATRMVREGRGAFRAHTKNE